MNVSGLVRSQRVQRFAVAGFVGGAGGYFLSTVLDEPTLLSTRESVRSYYAVYFMLIIGCVGVCLIFIDARLRGARVASDLFARAAIALVVLGLVSGYVGQILFETMLPDGLPLLCFDPDDCITWEVRVARMLSWGLAGVVGGLGVGLAFGTKHRIQKAAAGGLAGGLLGGLLFDEIVKLVGNGSPSLARLVSSGAIGLLIGAGIAAAESVGSPRFAEAGSAVVPVRLGQAGPPFPPPPAAPPFGPRPAPPRSPGQFGGGSSPPPSRQRPQPPYPPTR